MAGAQGRHRPIPDLIGDTFGLIGRRFRDVAVISIVAAAIAVISVALVPSPYGDFISNAIAGPIIAAIMTIAFALMYADLSGRSRPTADEWPESYS